MPKSKRNKQIELSKTKKHGLEGKNRLIEEIRKSVDLYKNIFVFSVNDMRNSKMKSVREQWKHSRFFIGKNKVMAIALGRFDSEEYRENLHKIGEQLKGQRGLFFTNQPADEVLKWFGSYSEGDFARSGNTATENVVLKEGPLPQFPHSLESYLRQLGLPTTLKKGVIHLIQDYTVCTEGDILSPETARVLKLLGYEMAEFYIRMECMWSQDGTFKMLDASDKENVATRHPASKTTADDDMEVAEDDEKSDDDDVPTLVPAGVVSPKEDVTPIETVQVKGKSKKNKESTTVPSDPLEDVTTEENAEEEDSNDAEEADDPAHARENGEDSDNMADDDSEPEVDSEAESESADAPEDKSAILEMTQQKLEDEPKPKKFSPKLTRSRAKATNTKIKTPEPLENITRSARKAPRKKDV